MPADDEQQLTRFLNIAASGDGEASDGSMPLIYRELQAIARSRMANERRDHTLQATALVHETWLRLLRSGDANWADRNAFYRAAANAMRQVLVEHARRRQSIKRGGGVEHSAESVADVVAPQPDIDDPETFLQLNDAIEMLEREDPRAGSVVRLRFFAGLDIDETAASLGLSRRTVLREWAFARARLFSALGGKR